MWPWRNKPDNELHPPLSYGARARRTRIRRPLIGALACLVAGVLTGLSFTVSPAWPLGTAFVTAAVGAALVRRTASVPFLWATIFLAAWAHAAMDARNPSARALGALMDRSREHMTVRGIIVDDPIQEPGRASNDVIWRMTLRVEAVDRLGRFQQASGTVDVHWRAASESVVPAYGERWSFTGVVRHRDRRDWRWAFLPPYRMQADEADGARLSSGHGNPVKHFSFAGRRMAAERLGRGLEMYPEVAGILRALLLGYRHELPTDHHRLFALTGTLHIFAISGLHVGIVGTLLLVGVRACGASRTRWVLYVGPLLILYTVATGMRPSALRACTMALAFSSAFLFNRKPDTASAWALAALLILAVAPTQLTSPGFIFSFVIVAGMIRLYPLFAGPAREWWAPDAYRVTSSDRQRSFSARGLIWVTGLAAASAAAWLSSAPLTAQYFNLFSPVALIGNLFVIPAAFVIVLTGILTLIFGLLSDFGAEVFNHANRVILSGLIGLVDGLARLPGGHWHVRSPGAGWIALWYGFIFGGLLMSSRRWRVFGYGLLVLLVGLGFALRQADRSSRVIVLNAGDGHAVLIRSGGEHMLFDAGPAYMQERLIRALRAEGVNRLRALVLSHPSASHAGGADAVLRAMPVRQVWCTAFASRSPAYDRALATAREQGIPVRRVAAGQYGEWPGDLVWELLHPTHPSVYTRAADASVVMHLSRGGASVLLMGGGGGRVEQDVLAARRDPAASVLVIGNQGRDGVAGGAWLEAVRPEAVVLAVGAYNRHGYPERAVLRRLEGSDKPPLWRTDESGAVEIVLRSSVRFGRRADSFRIESEWAAGH